jgi:hypothetical protein
VGYPTTVSANRRHGRRARPCVCGSPSSAPSSSSTQVASSRSLAACSAYRPMLDRQTLIGALELHRCRDPRVGEWLSRLHHQHGGIEDSGARGLDRSLGVLLDGVAMRGSLRAGPESLRLDDVIETNGLVLFSLDVADYPHATRKVASWILLGMGRLAPSKALNSGTRGDNPYIAIFSVSPGCARKMASSARVVSVIGTRLILPDGFCNRKCCKRFCCAYPASEASSSGSRELNAINTCRASLDGRSSLSSSPMSNG